VKRPKSLSSSLEHRLSGYALAASAAGVSVLALAPLSEGKIIYTPVHRVIGRNGRYKIDLNGDKISDVTIVNSYGCNQDYCVDALSAIASAGNHVEGKSSVAYALASKSVIGPKQPFVGKIMALSSSSFGTFGRWLNVHDGYLGVQFSIDGKTHYGWVRMTVRVFGHAKMVTTMTGYAYETIPNKPIIAGKTKGPDVITLEPATLGHLAQGASAISAWRAKESK
jgi:hypothetical protein